MSLKIEGDPEDDQYEHYREVNSLTLDNGQKIFEGFDIEVTREDKIWVAYVVHIEQARKKSLPDRVLVRWFEVAERFPPDTLPELPQQVVLANWDTSYVLLREVVRVLRVFYVLKEYAAEIQSGEATFDEQVFLDSEYHYCCCCFIADLTQGDRSLLHPELLLLEDVTKEHIAHHPFQVLEATIRHQRSINVGQKGAAFLRSLRGQPEEARRGAPITAHRVRPRSAKKRSSQGGDAERIARLESQVADMQKQISQLVASAKKRRSK